MTKGEARKIEDVQRRATKLIPELRDLPYEERLRKLDLPSMLYRHRRGDVIETWKFLTEKYDVKPEFMLEDERRSMLSDKVRHDVRQIHRTRGNPLKLAKTHVSTRQRSNFFTQRVINDWNGLPESVVTADTINAFKNRLDVVWRKDRFRTPYGAFADYLIDE